MAGAAGTNVDHAGFIMDPLLVDVAQHYKELGANPFLEGRMKHLIGGYRTVVIPTASVLTLNSVPIQIVPAPGAGKCIIPIMAVATMVYNSTTYAANASGASLKYGTAGAGTSTGITITQAFFQTSTGTASQVVFANATAYNPATTDFNVPLTLIMASADPTTGNSDVYVRVYYWILTLPFTTPSVP